MAMDISGLNKAILNTQKKLDKSVEEIHRIIGNISPDVITVLSSIKQLTEDIEKIKSQIYPIGSIYISLSSENPRELFGGEWEKLENRFLLGTGDNYNCGDTGGESTHTLTTAEMPKHGHNLGYGSMLSTNQNGLVISYTSGSSNRSLSIDNWSWQDNNTANNIFAQYAGESSAHNNMPPYLVVNMWKRVA